MSTTLGLPTEVVEQMNQGPRELIFAVVAAQRSAAVLASAPGQAAGNHDLAIVSVVELAAAYNAALCRALQAPLPRIDFDRLRIPIACSPENFSANPDDDKISKPND